MKLRYYFDAGPDDVEEFDFEIGYDEAFDHAVEYYAEVYGETVDERSKGIIRGILIDELIDFESDDYFIDYLKEIYENAAYEAYREHCEYQDDPYSYYGVSRWDFF